MEDNTTDRRNGKDQTYLRKCNNTNKFEGNMFFLLDAEPEGAKNSVKFRSVRH